MMKLFYKSGSCSLAPHIVLKESGLVFQTEAVDLKSKQTASGADYWQINPKGYVPALMLDSGEVITEGPAIGQYIADQAPQKKLAPANGTIERVRLQSWLTFIGRNAQDICAIFQPQGHAGMERHCDGQSRTPPGLCGSAADRPQLPDGRGLLGRRCLFVHRAELGKIRQDRSRPLARGAGLSGPGCRPAGSPVRLKRRRLNLVFFFAQRREENHIPDAGAIGQQHH